MSILQSIFSGLGKIIWYVLLIALVIGGVYSVMAVDKNKKAYSEVFGEIEEKNIYEDFNVFNCDLSGAKFYAQESGGFIYTTKIPQSVEFNGTKNKYNILLNETPSHNELSSAGTITADNTQTYYSTDGSILLQTTLNIEIKFYQSNIEINLSNKNTASQQKYFLEYIAFNGLHLQIIEKQYIPATSSTAISCVVNFIDYDGTTLLSASYDKGSKLSKPASPRREGFTFTGWLPTPPSIVTANATYTATYKENPKTPTDAYMQFFLNGELQSWKEKANIYEDFAEQGFSANDCYPVMYAWVGDESNSVDINVGTTLDCYDIYVTTYDTTVTIKVNDKLYYLDKSDDDDSVEFWIEFYVKSQGTKDDSIVKGETVYF